MSSALFAAVRLGTAALMLPGMLAIQAFFQPPAGPRKGDQPIFHAISLRDPLLMRYALEDGANCDSRDEMGSTPLQYCALAGDITMLRQLIDRGANVNARNDLGITALMMAATTNQAAAIELLLQHGADPTPRAKHEQMTALDIAELNEAWDAAVVLRRCPPVPRQPGAANVPPGLRVEAD